MWGEVSERHEPILLRNRARRRPGARRISPTEEKGERVDNETITDK